MKMTLKNNSLNAKDLFDIMQIRVETDDEYGRKGRGITLIYFNKDYEKTYFLPYKNVEEDVLKFKRILINSLYTNEEIEKETHIENVENMEIHNIFILNLLKDYKNIFGDLEDE